MGSNYKIKSSKHQFQYASQHTRQWLFSDTPSSSAKLHPPFKLPHPHHGLFSTQQALFNMPSQDIYFPASTAGFGSGPAKAWKELLWRITPEATFSEGAEVHQKISKRQKIHQGTTNARSSADERLQSCIKAAGCVVALDDSLGKCFVVLLHWWFEFD